MVFMQRTFFDCKCLSESKLWSANCNCDYMQNFVKEIYTKLHMSYLMIQDWAKDQRSLKQEDAVPILEV